MRTTVRIILALALMLAASSDVLAVKPMKVKNPSGKTVTLQPLRDGRYKVSVVWENNRKLAADGYIYYSQGEDCWEAAVEAEYDGKTIKEVIMMPEDWIEDREQGKFMTYWHMDKSSFNDDIDFYAEIMAAPASNQYFIYDETKGKNILKRLKIEYLPSSYEEMQNSMEKIIDLDFEIHNIKR